MTLPGPKRLSFEQREGRLLLAAQRLFSQRGYRGTTTRAIAQAAGINEALLFRHFPTKEALYNSLLNRTMEGWREEFLNTLPDLSQRALPEALGEISRRVIHNVSKDPSLLRMVVYASLEGHRLGKNFYKNKPPIKTFLEKFFIARQKRGEIRKGDAGLMAATYLSLVFYYIHMKEIFGAEKYYFGKESNTLECFIKIFLEGICR